MRPAPHLLAVVATAWFLAVAATPAEACSCVSGPSPCQAFARSAIVFVGEVVSAERTGDDFHMRLRVVRPLKGIATPTADLWSDANTSCGIKLAPGGRYVVHTALSGGRMSISACSYIQGVPFGEDDPELPPVPGRVYGQVVRYDVDRIREFRALEPIPGARVGLNRSDGRVTVTSDQQGEFRFDDVPPGKYDLAVDAGPGLTPWMARPVILPDRDDCVAAHIVLHPSGRLSGRTLTADGKPASTVYVRLLREGAAGSRLEQFVSLGTMSGSDGRFSFDGLRPDTYVVSVNPDGTDATSRQPYAAAFFGGADHASARRIALAEGAAIELDRPFILPPSLATRTFTVGVTCADGSSPAGLLTKAQAANRSDADEFGETGDGPVRTLKLLRDQAYTLRVSIFVPVGAERDGRTPRREEELPPTELPAGTPGRHFEFVAPFANCAERPR